MYTETKNDNDDFSILINHNTLLSPPKLLIPNEKFTISKCRLCTISAGDAIIMSGNNVLLIIIIE